MRITLFTASLAGGGAERAVVTLAEEFFRRGEKVSIVKSNILVPDFYQVPAGIGCYKVDIDPDSVSVRWYDLLGNIRRMKAIRDAIAKTEPDVVISFQDGTNELFILSCVGTRYLKLLSCQNDIDNHPHYNARWNILRKLMYRLADQIVFLDKEQARSAQERFTAWKCDGIPNPIPAIDFGADAPASGVINRLKKFPIRIAAMGRLTRQKGFDLLLTAFADVLKAVPDVGLVILGEGSLRPELEAERKRLGIENNVMMPGLMARPHSVIATCDLFAFSSRYEGQGLALVEAMACGVTPVSFDCPSGPSLIIENNVDGILVPPQNVGALADGMITLLLDEDKRHKMGERAREASARYNAGNICGQWEEMFQSLRDR